VNDTEARARAAMDTIVESGVLPDAESLAAAVADRAMLLGVCAITVKHIPSAIAAITDGNTKGAVGILRSISNGLAEAIAMTKEAEGTEE